LFIVRGYHRLYPLITGRTQVGGLDDVAVTTCSELFASDIPIGRANFNIAIVWWFIIAAVATWILMRTKIGNWIFGIGGSALAARNVGVPVNKLKIGLFMTTAFAAWSVATIQVANVKSADVLRGTQQEFVAIIATVIGGTLPLVVTVQSLACLGALAWHNCQELSCRVDPTGTRSLWSDVGHHVRLTTRQEAGGGIEKMSQNSSPLIEMRHLQYFGSVIAPKI
jgi:ABC-type uncharacterized transport system permease subunit